MEQKKLFVVLGMHRSGTSAITRGLQVLGVDLGDRLMPDIAENNEKGFYEDMDINALNVEMLNALHNDWFHLSLIHKNDWALLKTAGYFQRALELLQQKTTDKTLFGFKDPRLSKLLPFWKEVFRRGNYDVNYIVALRHPLSVALSIAKRNGIDIEKSHFLWLIHTVHSLSEVAGGSFVVVDYDNLMQDAGKQLERMAKQFHLQINLSEFEKYKSEFLDDGLRHTRFTYENLMTHERSFDFLRDVYATTTALANDNQANEESLLKKTVEWEAELGKMSSSFRMADGAFYQLNLQYLQTLEKENQRKKEQEAKELETKKLNESLAKSHQQALHIEELKAEISEKLQIISEKENIITARERSIAVKAEIIADQEEVIATNEQIIAEKELLIAQGNAAMENILNSKSWRITRPLRYIMKLFRKS